jgi:thioredoxin reductase (NADPH)
VVLFCNSWCPDCKRARAWFKINEIDYVEVDVMENREAGRMVREWANGNLVTPTFNINGTVIVNFNVSELEKTLGIQSK